ncbi:hypothetical protein TELCIR_14600 [Teladorsagia circumcincta]|uniref:Uncharacterized protein n=1 Tax=Teladorsagia circumcincta TaxID=45464 RepID=A0A2G9U0P9_TELCI|nr:hypothetical protein TELCIR_14600 [Teladorsagia circumcincta]
MFLVLLALCFLLVSLTSQEGPPQWRMPTSVKRTYIGYMHTNNPYLVWNDTLSEKAFYWVRQRDRPKGNYFLIDAAANFPRYYRWLEEKLPQLFYGGFTRWWIKVGH